MKNQPKIIYLNVDTNEDDLKYVSVDFLFAEIHRRFMTEEPTKENAFIVGQRMLFLENLKEELTDIIYKL